MMWLAAAGLCHDLGKWLERAHWPLTVGAGLEEELCPASAGGPYRYTHVLWSYQAALETVAPFLAQAGLPPAKAARFARLAARHHAPRLLEPAAALVCPTEEFILQQADWCASGLEGLPEDENRPDRRDTTLLAPLLAGPGDWRYALRPLAGAAAEPLPQAQAGQGQAQSENYRKLWAGFAAGLKGLPRPATPVQAVALLRRALSGYAWCIPQAANVAPDTSLYDHSRCTAALAQALFMYYHAEHTTKDQRAVTGAGRERRLWLVGGRIAGSERYLLRGRQAPPRAGPLRARAFFLESLTRAAASWLLARVDVPPLCLTVETGGEFQFLAPGNAALAQELVLARGELTQALLADVLGEVFLHLAWVPLSLADFTPAAYRQRRAALAQALEAAEAHPLGASRCWSEANFVRRFPTAPPPGDEGGPRPSNTEVEDLGRRLARGQAWALRAADRARPAPNTVPLLDGQLALAPLENSPQSLDADWLRTETAAGAGYLPCWTDERIAGLPEHLWRDPDQDAAAEPGQPMPFSALAAAGLPDGRGRKVLAVLRAELDGPGDIAGQDPGEKCTLAQQAGLARMLDYFFSVRALEIIRAEFPLTCPVRTGGTRLLLIGPWRPTLHLAARVREAWGCFTGRNPAWTLSAAVQLASPRLPLAPAAELARAALEESQASGPDRITVFGRTLTWEQFAAPADSGKLETWSALALGGWLGQFFGQADAPPLRFLRRAWHYAQVAEQLGKAAGHPDLHALMWPARYRYELARGVAPCLERRCGRAWAGTAEGQFWQALGEIPRDGRNWRMARMIVPFTYALHCLERPEIEFTTETQSPRRIT